MLLETADGGQGGEDQRRHQHLGDLPAPRQRRVEDVAADHIDHRHRHQEGEDDARETAADPEGGPGQGVAGAASGGGCLRHEAADALHALLDLLHFLTQLGEHLGRVGEPLVLGALDPLAVEVGQALLDGLIEGGVDRGDGVAGSGQRGVADLVGAIPHTAEMRRHLLAGDAHDRLLLGRRQGVELVPVHDRREARAIEPARDRVVELDDIAEPEAGDGFEREEDAVGHALAEQLVRLGGGRRDADDTEALGDRALGAAAGADLQALELLDPGHRLARVDHARAMAEQSQQLDALVLVEAGDVLLVDAPIGARHLLGVAVEAGELDHVGEDEAAGGVAVGDPGHVGDAGAHAVEQVARIDGWIGGRDLDAAVAGFLGLRDPLRPPFGVHAVLGSGIGLQANGRLGAGRAREGEQQRHDDAGKGSSHRCHSITLPERSRAPPAAGARCRRQIIGIGPTRHNRRARPASPLRASRSGLPPALPEPTTRGWHMPRDSGSSSAPRRRSNDRG